jgi:hypothetical protein
LLCSPSRHASYSDNRLGLEHKCRAVSILVLR